MELSTGHDLLRYNLKDKKILVSDLESNGLHLKYTLPFNISLCVYQNGNILENHDLYIKWPEYKIRDDLAIKVHYNKEKIDIYGKQPNQVFEFVKEYLNNPEYLVIGSNWLNYDCMVIKNAAKSVGVDISYDYLRRVYDCNSLFKGYKLNRKPNYDDFLAWQWGLNSIVQKGLKSSVKTCCAEFGIDYSELDSHSGAYDVSRSYLIFMELIKKMEIK